jgi:hypothetical protein
LPGDDLLIDIRPDRQRRLVYKLTDRRFRFRGEQSFERDEAEETWAIEDREFGRVLERTSSERIARSANETLGVGTRYVMHRKIGGRSTTALRKASSVKLAHESCAL